MKDTKIKFNIKPKFKNQSKRIDVLGNMIYGYKYIDIIENNGDKKDNKSYQGFIYETISIILAITRCLNVFFTQILVGKFEEYDTQQVLDNIITLLDCPINQGDDKSDLTLLTSDGYKIAWSIKYRDNESADIDKLGISTLKLNCHENDKIGLIVKNKKKITEHRYNTKCSKSQELLNDIIKNNLLLDEYDIKNGYENFKVKFGTKYHKKIGEFIENINLCYLDCERKLLVQKLHQAMFRNKIIDNIKKGYLNHLIQNKPRSGKSILMLLIAYDLLKELKKNKILVMTSVPSTIKSFIDDLNKWDIFRDIVYRQQTDFMELKTDFVGICFTSVQFLKKDNIAKKTQLKQLGFDACIFDESDFGSSTEKTLADILNFTKSIKNEFKINIFASGTASKTRMFYKIPKKFVYNWDIEDENLMKSIDNTVNYGIMSKRHGEIFNECFSKDYINKDYSNCPSQVLIQPQIMNNMIKKIENYNTTNNTDFGYSISSILSLKQKKPNKKDKSKYKAEFEICGTEQGEKFLKEVLENIISEDPMKETIESYIEKTQSIYNSRKTDIKDPKLIIVYLPTGNRKGVISILQKTLIIFLKKHNLWSNYHMCYTNSEDSSSDSKCHYNEFIDKQITLTKTHNKKGCILFLGRKGGRGNTYYKCDVTISFDDGHNIDEQKQRNYRALTPAPGKTIGINVDLNIQRTYYLISNMIQKYKKFKPDKSYAEILKYLTEQKIFIFNPQDINYTNIIDTEITKYYNSIASKLRDEIKEDTLLENIVCDDLLNDYIGVSFNTSYSTNNIINNELEGRQKDCPKPGEKKTLIDKEEILIETEIETEIDKETDTTIVNKTKELVKKIVPILCSISRNENKKNIYDIIKKDGIYRSLIDYNINKFNIKFDLSKIKDIIISIMKSNEQIINDMIELYSNASPSEYRSLIEKHYLPSDRERKDNAEIPTPVKLVDEMLDIVPNNVFEKLSVVGELCCGKGNFILAIFDRFVKGLEDKYDDRTKLCEDIIEKCLYFSDIEPNNIFFTKQLLICHAHSYTAVRKTDYKFNIYEGNTLEIDIKSEWGIDKFDIIIGNPPYENRNKKGDNHLYIDFTVYSINNLKENGYLLYITPKLILDNLLRCDINRKRIDKLYNITHIAIDTPKKYFPNIGTNFIYFLLEKNQKCDECSIKYLEGSKINTTKIQLVEGMNLPNIFDDTGIKIINKTTNKIVKDINKNMFSSKIKRAQYNFNNKLKLQRLRNEHFKRGIVKNEEDSEFKYKMTNGFSIKKYLYPGGLCYFNHKMTDYNKSKIVINDIAFVLGYDSEGTLNLSDSLSYILGNENDYNNFKILVKSKLIRFLLIFYKNNTQHDLNKIMKKNLYDIPLDKCVNDIEIFNHYNLSNEEIDYINSIVK